jgi:CheY-like chemotaxis protein
MQIAFVNWGTSKMTRILIADDHDVVRSGLRAVLNAHPNWEVVAEAADGKEAIFKAIETKPDIAVVDYSLPLINVMRKLNLSSSADRPPPTDTRARPLRSTTLPSVRSVSWRIPLCRKIGTGSGELHGAVMTMLRGSLTVRDGRLRLPVNEYV